MTTFFADLGHPFLQYAVMAGVLASISCGVVGSLVVARRMTYIAGAIAHSVLGGMGAARYLQRNHGWEWLTPLIGATVAAIASALIIAYVTINNKERQDTVLSAIWAIGMAVGITFIHATSGYREDLMSYLFGNILMVTKAGLWQMAVLNVVVVGLALAFYDKLLVIGFQPELARLRGISVPVYETLFLVLTALAVVLLSQIVGLILVIALLTLPAATAGQFVGKLWAMMIVAAVLCFIFTITGLAIAYDPDLPAGATIVETAGVAYLAALGAKWAWRKVSSKK